MNLSNVNLTKLDRDIADYCEREKITGVLRITVQDRIVFEKSIGYANIAEKTPFTDKSMFTLYSLSKPFCAMAVMLLKDRGLVDIDRHPGDYVPEAKGFNEKLTIRHLMHHVSGLPDFSATPDFVKDHKTGYPSEVRAHMAEIAKFPQNFEPGTQTQYANINMVLLALIVENVSGTAYADFMKKEIFEPLGMKTAVVDNEKLYIENRVQGYTLVDDTVCETGKTHNWMFGAGDIVGTVDDVYALNLAIKHQKLLKAETWEEILTRYPINSFGCGCTISHWHGQRWITHNGGSRGFRTFHRQFTEDDFDLIILSNSGYGNARNDLAEIVYEAFYGADTPAGKQAEMDKGYI